MVATKPADIRSRQKEYFEQAYMGETVIVSRPQNKNVVIISEKKYNEMLQAQRMQEYVSRLYGGRDKADSADSASDGWALFFEGIDLFSDDFMSDYKDNAVFEDRESL